jgi:tetraacyldisaccharide 4'-kinase
MRLEPPRWWYGSRPIDRLTALLLTPASWLYGLAAEARFAFAKSYRSSLPVVCIGNFTVGGAGKTPLAIEVCRILRALGRSPAFLTRGFGGRIEGPHRVDPETDLAGDTGDEALLLARAAPAFVARKRPEGARAIEASGADVIVMDDGFQNPSLAKDLSLIAVDGGAGLGNRAVVPAGPLRAPLAAQLRRADAVIWIGGAPGAIAPRIDASLPLLRAEIAPSGDAEWLRSKRVIAYSGIGRPSKFFATLENLGARVVETRAFPDHHGFTETEARQLLSGASNAKATLVTTEKDWVRIEPSGGVLAELKRASRVVPIKIALGGEDESRLITLLRDMLNRH